MHQPPPPPPLADLCADMCALHAELAAHDAELAALLARLPQNWTVHAHAADLAAAQQAAIGALDDAVVVAVRAGDLDQVEWLQRERVARTAEMRRAFGGLMHEAERLVGGDEYVPGSVVRRGDSTASDGSSSRRAHRAGRSSGDRKSVV